MGLLAGNGPEWLAVAFGVWRAGATLVPISTFVTARELGEILAHADVDALVLQPRLRSHDYQAYVERCGPLPRLRHVIALSDGHAAGPITHPALSNVDPESIACIVYTSGTSGRPKGVMLSHRAILATVVPTAERSGLTSADATLTTLPLFWVAGLIIRALPTLTAGSALILPDVFTPAAVVSLLRQYRPSAIHLRPPQIGQLLAHPDFDPTLLSTIRRGGGRVEWYAPVLSRQDVRLVTGYGMTEMAGYVVALDWRDSPATRRTQLGQPLPGVQVRIDGASAPGDVGEIRVRGPGLFSGYYKRPPRAGLDADGFLMTGDLGCFDGDGRLQFVGRSKDLLRVKGINVSPVEVEGVLQQHPAVEAAHVVGLPPDGLEQQLVALVIRKPGCGLDESELRHLVNDLLSHYKRPARYLFIAREDVPLGATAKPQRRALAALAERLLRGELPRGAALLASVENGELELDVLERERAPAAE